MKIQSHLDEIQKEAEDYEAMSLAVTCFFYEGDRKAGTLEGKDGQGQIHREGNQKYVKGIPTIS